MKRKILVVLIIFGMVFSILSNNFILNAGNGELQLHTCDWVYLGGVCECSVSGVEDGVWMITNHEGEPLDEPIVEDIPPNSIEIKPTNKGKIKVRIVVSKPYQTTLEKIIEVRWYDNFTFSTCREVYAGDECFCKVISGVEEGLWIITNSEGKPLDEPIVEDIPPTSMKFVPKRPGKVLVRVTCFKPYVGVKKEYVIVKEKKNPPNLNVTWHVPDQFEYGKPNPLWFETCNSGGDADVEHEMWISGDSQGPTTWHIYSGGCVTSGWHDNYYVYAGDIQDGYIKIRFWARATNNSGTDTYDETKKIPVVGMEGSIKVIVKDDSGDRVKNASIYLDGSYEGKTNSSGEYTISNLAPNEYKVEASKSGYYDDYEYVYLEAAYTETVYLTLEEIPPPTTTPRPTTPSPTTPRPTTPKPTTPRPTTPSPTTPSPTKSPCDRDSDNDGVPDCEDECENTPPEYYVDEKGCRLCLNKKAVCSLQAKGLIPVYGVIPSSKIVINDLCLLADAINSGEDAITIILLADTLCRDAIGFIVDALMTIGKFDIRLTVLYTAIKSARFIIDCGLDFADSYGADKSFCIGIHDGLSEKFAEENINAMNLYVGSPVELVIKDEKGNVLSKDNDMGIQEGFFFEHNHYKFAFVINPEGEYKVETIGIDEGTYDLKIKTIMDGKITKSKEFDDVQTSQGKVDTYNVNISSSGKVDIEKSGKSPFKYLLIVVIILLFSIIGFYIYGGKKGGMAGPPISGEKSRLTKKLDRQYETGKINKDEYFQKMKDLGLSPENKILKKLEEKFARGEISKKEYLLKKRDLEA